MMMNKNYPLCIEILIPIGSRIELISMNDPFALPSGIRGTVDSIDSEGQIHVKWDNGSSLALIYGVDKFKVVPSECGTKYVIMKHKNGVPLYYKDFINNKMNYTFDINNSKMFDNLSDAESIYASLKKSNYKIYPVCPRCHRHYEEYSAISRADNKSEICEICGLTEALMEFFEYEALGVKNG